MCKVKQRRNKQEKSSDRQIRPSDTAGFQRRVSCRLFWGHDGKLIGRVFDAGKDERTTDDWSHDSSNGIEGLRQVQPPFRRFRRTKNGDVRVGGDLQYPLPASHHKQREKEETVQPNRSCGDE